MPLDGAKARAPLSLQSSRLTVPSQVALTCTRVVSFWTIIGGSLCDDLTGILAESVQFIAQMAASNPYHQTQYSASGNAAPVGRRATMMTDHATHDKKHHADLSPKQPNAPCLVNDENPWRAADFIVFGERLESPRAGKRDQLFLLRLAGPLRCLIGC